MPNGHDYSKEYGSHDYGEREGTQNCRHGCKCWMEPTRSGGPIGLDPFGECPNNPLDERRLGGGGTLFVTADHEVVAERRIERLYSHINELQMELEKTKEKLAAVKPSKAKLAWEIKETRAKLIEFRNRFIEIKKIAQGFPFDRKYSR